MKLSLGIILMLVGCAMSEHCAANQPCGMEEMIKTQIDNAEANDVKLYALLVAGSNTWWNYRHQADVCHAY